MLFFYATFGQWDDFCMWYMVYAILYVVYGIKMAFMVYSLIFDVCHMWAVYNVVHIFLVLNPTMSVLLLCT